METVKKFVRGGLRPSAPLKKKKRPVPKKRKKLYKKRNVVLNKSRNVAETQREPTPVPKKVDKPSPRPESVEIVVTAEETPPKVDNDTESESSISPIQKRRDVDEDEDEDEDDDTCDEQDPLFFGTDPFDDDIDEEEKPKPKEKKKRAKKRKATDVPDGVGPPKKKRKKTIPKKIGDKKEPKYNLTTAASNSRIFRDMMLNEDGKAVYKFDQKALPLIGQSNAKQILKTYIQTEQFMAKNRKSINGDMFTAQLGRQYRKNMETDQAILQIMS